MDNENRHLVTKKLDDVLESNIFSKGLKYLVQHN